MWEKSFVTESFSKSVHATSLTFFDKETKRIQFRVKWKIEFGQNPKNQRIFSPENSFYSSCYPEMEI